MRAVDPRTGSPPLQAAVEAVEAVEADVTPGPCSAVGLHQRSASWMERECYRLLVTFKKAIQTCQTQIND